ncbi:MAG: hypothetical protein ABI361_05795 [Nitrososphaera sp.]
MVKKTAGKKKTSSASKAKARKKSTPAKSRSASRSRKKTAARKKTPTKSRALSKPSIARAQSIVRIMGEGQYRLAASDLSELNRVDNSIVKYVEDHSDNSHQTQQEFQKRLNEMITIVRSRGEQLGESELVASDVILPFPDTTLEEARDLFKNDGLIPG